MRWRVEIYGEPAAKELADLPEDMQARFLRIAERIEQLGLNRVTEPHVKHVEGKLWEMRMNGRDGIARGLYIAANPRRVVVLRIFLKKTQKTPRTEIELALNRAKDLGL